MPSFVRFIIAFVGGRARAWGIVQLLIALAVTVAATIIVQRPFHGDHTPTQRAETLQRSGRLGPAERLYWETLRAGPVTVPLLVAFLDNHHGQRALAREGIVLKGDAYVVPEADIDALLADKSIPEDVALLGTFWRAVLAKSMPTELHQAVVAHADREPPTAYANRLLGLEARREGRLVEAAARLEREAIRHADHAEDFALAMHLLSMAEAWDEIGSRMNDPALERRVPAPIRYGYAVRSKSFPLALRAIVATAMQPRPTSAVLLAGISCVMWLLFTMRMGRAGERRVFRISLYLGALVLGVLSVVPTMIIVGFEDSVLHFHERGDLMSDLIFFTVGVGLREEISKLLLFLPLLPILRRYGTRLDVLTCGAVVGLGFASEENIGYLQGGLSTALSRFLTANFLHMALTALLAVAAFDLSRDIEKGAAAFSRTLLTVVAMHGAYDFFLSNPQVEGLSFLSMTIFVVLTRMFMTELASASSASRGTRSAPLLPRFLQAVVVVTCASYVYAASLVGPISAAFALTQGLLGVILIFIMFVQEMRRA